MSLFTKFTVSKSHFSRNSHFQNLIFSQNSLTNEKSSFEFSRYDKGNRRRIFICRQWEDNWTLLYLKLDHHHLLKSRHRLSTSTMCHLTKISKTPWKLAHLKVRVALWIRTLIHLAVATLSKYQRHLANAVRVTILVHFLWNLWRGSWRKAIRILLILCLEMWYLLIKCHLVMIVCNARDPMDLMGIFARIWRRILVGSKIITKGLEVLMMGSVVNIKFLGKDLWARILSFRGKILMMKKKKLKLWKVVFRSFYFLVWVLSFLPIGFGILIDFLNFLKRYLWCYKNVYVHNVKNKIKRLWNIWCICTRNILIK